MAHLVHVIDDSHDAWWAGGAYIDIVWHDADDIQRSTVATINVWDYEADTRLVPYTRDALAARVQQWLDERDNERDEA